MPDDLSGWGCDLMATDLAISEEIKVDVLNLPLPLRRKEDPVSPDPHREGTRRSNVRWVRILR